MNNPGADKADSFSAFLQATPEDQSATGAKQLSTSQSVRPEVSGGAAEVIQILAKAHPQPVEDILHVASAGVFDFTEGLSHLANLGFVTITRQGNTDMVDLTEQGSTFAGGEGS